MKCDRAWINSLLNPVMQSQKMELKKDFEGSYGTLHCPKAEPALLRTLWTAVRKTAVLKSCNDGNSTLSLSNVFQSFSICTAGMFFLMFNFNHLCSLLFFVLSPSGTVKRFLSSLQQPVLSLNTVNMLPPQTFSFLGYACPVLSVFQKWSCFLALRSSACAVAHGTTQTVGWAP